MIVVMCMLNFLMWLNLSKIDVVLMSFQVINLKSTMLEFYAYEEIEVW